MKKFITILVALGIVSAVGTVVACATDETEPETTAQTTETVTQEETEVITTELNDEATLLDGEEQKTEIVTETNTDVATGTDVETTTETDSTEENTDNAEVIESESETDTDTDVTENEDISIPQTGDKRKILPVITTLIVSGITAAYCVVKGKKTKKTKADGE